MLRRKRSVALRHKRLNRSGRLRVAKAWISSYPGKDIARGYRKYFGLESIPSARFESCGCWALRSIRLMRRLCWRQVPRRGKGKANRRKRSNSCLSKKIIGDLHSSLDTRREVYHTA